MKLRFLSQHADPVLRPSEGIRYGFEGGRALKLDGRYHLFSSEMFDAPIWAKMRLGHWSSADGLAWRRESTLRESSGVQDGKDERAALWSPMPAWDPGRREWNLFYVAYKSLPNTPEQFLANHHGRIVRAVSKGGIAGPYEDRGVILKPGPESQDWEGLMGVDSFFPWKTASGWRAFYGSARSETLPIPYWRVGMASAPDIAGPWLRDPGNPSPLEPKAAENPVVTELPGGGWIAVYDQVEALDGFGWAFSADGVHWPQGSLLRLPPGWCRQVRTPLGLVSEGGRRFSLFYTGFEGDPDWAALMAGRGEHRCSVGLAELEVEG